METGEEVYQRLTPVGPVRNITYRLAEQQRSNDDAISLYSFIAQMSKKISYFTPPWGLVYSANCNQTHVTKKQLSNMSNDMQHVVKII